MLHICLIGNQFLIRGDNIAFLVNIELSIIGPDNFIEGCFYVCFKVFREFCHFFQFKILTIYFRVLKYLPY